MSTFRTIFRSLTPGWMHNGEGELVLYSLARVKDAYLERVKQGLEARFPSRAPNTALAKLSQDRGMPRGPTEPAEHFALRLIKWRHPRGHRGRGGAYALIDQVRGMFGDKAGWTIDKRGNYFRIAEDGTETSAHGLTWGWLDEPALPNWGKFWVALEVVGDATVRPWPDFGNPDLWGGDMCVPGTTIGMRGMTPQDLDAIRALFKGDHPWKPLGTQEQWIIIDFDGASPTVDATWKRWSKIDAGVQVASRHTGWRYIAMRGNDYTSDGSEIADSFTLPDGTTHTPLELEGSDTYELPSGEIYVAQPVFHDTITLVDDGDLPS